MVKEKRRWGGEREREKKREVNNKVNEVKHWQAVKPDKGCYTHRLYTIFCNISVCLKLLPNNKVKKKL